MNKAIESSFKADFEEQRSEGRREGMLNTLASLVKDGILTLADASRHAQMTPNDFPAKTAALTTES